MFEIINSVLAITGLFSIVIFIIRIIWTFSSSYEWYDNIKIEEYSLNEEIELKNGVYPQIIDYSDQNIYSTKNLFIPNGMGFKNIKIKKFITITKKGKLKFETCEVIKNITPDRPLCLIISRSETLPNYSVEWRVKYGGKATYYLTDNLRNGDNFINGIDYKFSMLSKVRKVLNLE